MVIEVESVNEVESEETENDLFDVIIVGAGAAGIGVGIALAHAGVDNFLIIDRGSVGSSLLHGLRRPFHNHSFPSNSIGMLDLNL